MSSSQTKKRRRDSEESNKNNPRKKQRQDPFEYPANYPPDDKIDEICDTFAEIGHCNYINTCPYQHPANYHQTPTQIEREYDQNQRNRNNNNSRNNNKRRHQQHHQHHYDKRNRNNNNSQHNQHNYDNNNRGGHHQHHQHHYDQTRNNNNNSRNNYHHNNRRNNQHIHHHNNNDNRRPNSRDNNNGIRFASSRINDQIDLCQPGYQLNDKTFRNRRRPLINDPFFERYKNKFDSRIINQIPQNLEQNYYHCSQEIKDKYSNLKHMIDYKKISRKLNKLTTNIRSGEYKNNDTELIKHIEQIQTMVNNQQSKKLKNKLSDINGLLHSLNDKLTKTQMANYDLISKNLMSYDELNRLKKFEEPMKSIDHTVRILYSSLNESSSSWNTNGTLCRNFFGKGKCSNTDCRFSHSIEKSLFKAILNARDLKSALKPLQRLPNKLYSDYQFMEQNSESTKQFERKKKQWIEKERTQFINEQKQQKQPHQRQRGRYQEF